MTDFDTLDINTLCNVHGGNRTRFLRGLADRIGGWLGPGAHQRNTPAGAPQFMSPGGDRVIRFDLAPNQHKGAGPHINLQDKGISPRHNQHIPVGE
jgi:hypothetical protein